MTHKIYFDLNFYHMQYMSILSNILSVVIYNEIFIQGIPVCEFLSHYHHYRHYLSVSHYRYSLIIITYQYIHLSHHHYFILSHCLSLTIIMYPSIYLTITLLPHSSPSHIFMFLLGLYI